MKSNIKKLDVTLLPETVHLVGEVTRSGGNGFSVKTDQGLIGTRRAVSCLLEPETGDTVLVSGQGPDRIYIIAVLERCGDGPATISISGDARFAAVDGSMVIAADKGVSLTTKASIELVSEELLLKNSQTTLLFRQLSLIGREIASTVGGVRLVGNVLESVFDRVIQTAKLSLRTVTGVDKVRSATIDYRAEQTMSLRGENVLASAREIVKVDGEQILLG